MFILSTPEVICVIGALVFILWMIYRRVKYGALEPPNVSPHKVMVDEFAGKIVDQFSINFQRSVVSIEADFFAALAWKKTKKNTPRLTYKIFHDYVRLTVFRFSAETKKIIYSADLCIGKEYFRGKIKFPYYIKGFQVEKIMGLRVKEAVKNIHKGVDLSPEESAKYQFLESLGVKPKIAKRAYQSPLLFGLLCCLAVLIGLLLR